MAVRTKRLLDFGPNVPVAVSQEAKDFLSELPRPAVRALLRALEDWAKAHTVSAARIFLYTDMEDEDWTEAVIELFVDTDDDDEGFVLTEQLAAATAKVKHTMSSSDRAAINHNVGIHLEWGIDWDDESSAV